jgi:hypothetical protein
LAVLNGGLTKNYEIDERRTDTIPRVMSGTTIYYSAYHDGFNGRPKALAFVLLRASFDNEKQAQTFAERFPRACKLRISRQDGMARINLWISFLPAAGAEINYSSVKQLGAIRHACARLGIPMVQVSVGRDALPVGTEPESLFPPGTVGAEGSAKVGPARPNKSRFRGV